MKIKANVIGYDGNLSGSYTIPTPHNLIRPGFVSAECPLGFSNLFTLSGVDSQGVIMNRRYTIVEAVKIKVTEAGGANPVVLTVPCVFRPDARDTVSGETAVVSFTGPKDSADETKAHQIQLSINFNYNDGKITNQGTLTLAEDAELNYEYVGCKVSLRFTAKNSDKGRTIVNIETQMTDITIDPKSFIGIYKQN